MDEIETEEKRTEISAPIEPIAERVARKLPGLRYVLDRKGLGRREVAEHLRIDPKRFYAIVGNGVRAEPWEIDALRDHLNVALDDITVIPADAPPKQTRSRRSKAPADRSDGEPHDDDGTPPEGQFEEGNSIAETGGLTAVTKPPEPPSVDVSLNITLPDGLKFTIIANQSPSKELLQKMSQALMVLASND